MDGLERWLDLLDMVNVIDRLSGWLMGQRYGGSYQLVFDRSVFLGADVEAMLARRGVRVFGRRVTSKCGMLSVPTRQADWAEYILMRGGVPLLNGPRNAGNPGWAARHSPGELPPAWIDREPTKQRRRR